MNLNFLLNKVRRTVKSHDLGDGNYARYLWQSPEGDRRMGPNEYGCADAANILYTIGDFPTDAAGSWLRILCVGFFWVFDIKGN